MLSSAMSLGVVASAEGIDYGADGRLVDDACGEHAAQDAVHHVVEAGLRDLAVLHGFFQRGVEVVVVAGHLLIEAGEGGWDGAVGCAPVGDDPALEVEVLLEDLVEEVVVLAGVFAFDEVIGAHDAGGVGDADGDLEGEEVGFAHGLVVELDIDHGAAGLLIVEGVVLDVVHDVLREDAFFERAGQGSGEDGVFAGVLEVAAVAGLAGDVGAAADGHVEAEGAELAADDGAVEEGGVRVPAGGGAEGGGKKRGVTALIGGHADSNGGVGEINVRNAKAGDAFHKSCAEV